MGGVPRRARVGYGGGGIVEGAGWGQVRLLKGLPVAGARVMLFDLADLRRGAVATATTDQSGYFALPQAALGGSALPQAWTLGQNYPNPFNPSTIIPYPPDPKACAVARAVGEAVHPDQVILFGSRARGDFTPDSDIVTSDTPEKGP